MIGPTFIIIFRVNTIMTNIFYLPPSHHFYEYFENKSVYIQIGQRKVSAQIAMDQAKVLIMTHMLHGAKGCPTHKIIAISNSIAID